MVARFRISASCLGSKNSTIENGKANDRYDDYGMGFSFGSASEFKAGGPGNQLRLQRSEHSNY
jgi:hypothetical protein